MKTKFSMDTSMLVHNTLISSRRSGRTTELAALCVARDGIMLFPHRAMADHAAKMFPGLRVGTMFGNNLGAKGPVYFDHTCLEVAASLLHGLAHEDS